MDRIADASVPADSRSTVLVGLPLDLRHQTLISCRCVGWHITVARRSYLTSRRDPAQPLAWIFRKRSSTRSSTTSLSISEPSNPHLWSGSPGHTGHVADSSTSSQSTLSAGWNSGRYPFPQTPTESHHTRASYSSPITLRSLGLSQEISTGSATTFVRSLPSNVSSFLDWRRPSSTPLQPPVILQISRLPYDLWNYGLQSEIPLHWFRSFARFRSSMTLQSSTPAPPVAAGIMKESWILRPCRRSEGRSDYWTCSTNRIPSWNFFVLFPCAFTPSGFRLATQGDCHSWPSSSPSAARLYARCIL